MVIPTYNRARLLVEALESVKAQTYRPIEIVVVDDGSADETAGVLREWSAAAADEVGLSCEYRRQDNRGAPAARNAALGLVRGEFIQYLDSDDTLGAGKVEAQVDALAGRPDWDIVAGESYELESGARAEPLIPLTRLEGLRRCITSWTLAVNNPLFRRSACDRLGPWDERMRCFEDASYMAGIFCKGLGLGFVAGADSYIRAHHAGDDGSYGPRVSYRGEPERLRDNVLALYWHHRNVTRDFPAELAAESKFAAALAKERFRVARKLLQVGEGEKAAELLRGSAQGLGTRGRLDHTTLRWLTALLGARSGATVHERSYDLLHRVRTALRS